MKRTLEQVFSEDSPIKDLSVTILDNHSTDGSSELIDEYKTKFPNIKHIIHRYNVGGNGNIVKAMELPTKKYFWILCDDDMFDWSNWAEIESAIEKDYDSITLEWKQPIPKDDPIPYFLNNAAFLPSTIYKTELIDSNLMYNSYCNILYSLPHLTLAAKLINENKRIYIANKKIIEAGINRHESVKTNPNIHFRARHFDLYVAYVCSYQLIKDKKLREKCIDGMHQGGNFWNSCYDFVRSNLFYSFNYCDFFNAISFRQKIIFITTLIFNFVGLYFYKSKKGLYIYFFGIKTKLIPFKH